MGFGFLLASVYLISSGTAWLSETMLDGDDIGKLSIIVNLSGGITMLVVAVGSMKFSRWWAYRRTCIILAVVAALANFLIILAGPYYLSLWVPYAVTRVLFRISGVVFGVCMGFLAIFCARLYGTLPPRQVIIYTAFCQIIVATTFYFTVGSPAWAPAQGGPSLIGILFYIAMPLLAGYLLSLSPYAEIQGASVEKKEVLRALPCSFWKLLIVVLVFSCMVSSVYSRMVTTSPTGATLDGTRFVMLLRTLLAFALIAIAITSEGKRLNFGKAYSAIMVTSVALVACLPLATGLSAMLTQTAALMSAVFELLLWCILAFIVYQRRISVLVVFGFGYGAYLVGTGLGWFAGARALEGLISAVGDTFAYMFMAIIVLACAFLIFSEREFDALFGPKEDGAPSLEDMLAWDYAAETEAVDGADDAPSGKRRRFDEALLKLAQEYQLTAREADVMRCVAMGYDSSTMADKLCLAWNTVRTYRRNVYGKMGVHSRQELMKLVEERSSQD